MTSEETPDATPLTLTTEQWQTRMHFYSGIGQGISFWASMESLIVQIAARLIGTTDEKAGLIFYSINNFYAWLSIIDDLFVLSPAFAAHKETWNGLTAILRELNDTRVRLAHHTVWDSDDPTIALRPGKYDTRSKSRKHQPLTDPQIEAFSAAVLETEKRLGDLALSVLAISLTPTAPTASPGTRRE
jgi:hypothetical protein